MLELQSSSGLQYFLQIVLSKNKIGTDPARKELDRAARYQRQAEQGIRDAKKSDEGINGAIDRSEKAVSDAAGTAGWIERDNQRAGVVIAECQQIIETVRRRGKVPPTQN